MPKNNNENLSEGESKPLNTTYELFIVFLSLYSIVVVLLATVIPVKQSTVQILIIIDNFIVVVFFYDFIRQLYRAPRKIAYLKWGWMDLLSSMPGFYYMRLLRIGRIVRTSNTLRATTGRSLWETFKEHRAESAVLTTTFTLFFLILATSILILNVEQESTVATISSPEDAVWWTFVTMTTVGYGDKVPTTSAGRLIGFILMAGGIVLLAVFTGYVASYFNPTSDREFEEIEKLRKDIAEIKQLLIKEKENNGRGELKTGQEDAPYSDENPRREYE